MNSSDILSNQAIFSEVGPINIMADNERVKSVYEDWKIEMPQSFILFNEREFNARVVSGALIFFSGVMDGLNQTLVHHYDSFKKIHPYANDQFWNPTVSWKNKYKNWDEGNTREKFPFSKSILVWTTDGYHLTRTLDRASMVTGLYINLVGTKKKKWYYYPLEIMGTIIIRSAGFHLVYTIIY